MNQKDLPNREWFDKLQDELRSEFQAVTQSARDCRPNLEAQRRELQDKCKGWTTSLADPNLDLKIRELIQDHLTEALGQLDQVADLIAQSDLAIQSPDDHLDLAEALRRREQLARTIEAGDPTTMNLELAQYIDRIDCFVDERVTVRICRLGEFPSVIRALRDLPQPGGNFAPASDDAAPGDPAKFAAKPRRRARLRSDPFAEDAAKQKDAAHFVADPDRFENLPDKWFTEETVAIPPKTCWASENAAAVARMRLSEHKTHLELAEFFKKTVPTIRDALKRAERDFPELKNLPTKMPRPRCAIEHADEVGRMEQAGNSVLEIAKHFKKSDTTIREALAHFRRRHKANDEGPAPPAPPTHDGTDDASQSTP